MGNKFNVFILISKLCDHKQSKQWCLPQNLIRYGNPGPLHSDHLQVQSATFDAFIQVVVADIGINKEKKKSQFSI